MNAASKSTGPWAGLHQPVVVQAVHEIKSRGDERLDACLRYGVDFVSRFLSCFFGSLLAGLLLLAVVHEYARWRIGQAVEVISKQGNAIMEDVTKQMRKQHDQIEADLAGIAKPFEQKPPVKGKK